MSSPRDGRPGRLEPKLLTVLREGISREQLLRDAGAGVVVGVVAVPLALAFAIASGVPPARGLVTAVVAGLLISALGGSRVQIGGPTGAFVVLVAGVVGRHGLEGLTVATLLAGVLLVVLGVARLGAVIRFIPYPVTVGFTAGIALLIAVSQLPDLLGLGGTTPADVLPRLAHVATHLHEVDATPLAVGIMALLVTALWPRVAPRIPSPLVAVVACTLLVQLLDLSVVTVGDRFGALPDGLPTPSVPAFDLETVRAVAPDAVAIALLAAIESLLSAVVADGMAGTRHRPDMELVAQGVANIAVPLFGGIPATGAIARTATNVRSGGRTPVAGMVHALTVLGAMLFLGGAVARIPLAALAGILLVVAFHMSEWRVFAHLFRSPRSDVAVLLTTFALTVAIDLAVAIQVGVVLASILFLRRMASLSDARLLRPMLVEEEEPQPPIELPPGVDVYEVHGALFFGAASKFREAVRPSTRRPRVLVLRMRDVVAIDATGLRALEDILDKSRRDGTALVLSGVRPQPRRAMERSGLRDRIGAGHVHADLPEALAHARALVGEEDEAPREARG